MHGQLHNKAIVPSRYSPRLIGTDGIGMVSVGIVGISTTGKELASSHSNMHSRDGLAAAPAPDPAAVGHAWPLYQV